jgi:hypothetical protein
MYFLRKHPGRVDAASIKQFVDCPDFVEKLLNDKNGIELLLHFA